MCRQSIPDGTVSDKTRMAQPDRKSAAYGVSLHEKRANGASIEELCLPKHPVFAGKVRERTIAPGMLLRGPVCLQLLTKGKKSLKQLSHGYGWAANGQTTESELRGNEMQFSATLILPNMPCMQNCSGKRRIAPSGSPIHPSPCRLWLGALLHGGCTAAG